MELCCRHPNQSVLVSPQLLRPSTWIRRRRSRGCLRRVRVGESRPSSASYRGWGPAARSGCSESGPSRCAWRDRGRSGPMSFQMGADAIVVRVGGEAPPPPQPAVAAAAAGAVLDGARSASPAQPVFALRRLALRPPPAEPLFVYRIERSPSLDCTCQRPTPDGPHSARSRSSLLTSPRRDE